MFLYSVHTDYAAHQNGWTSPEYLKAIGDGDRQVGEMLRFLKGEGLYDGTHIMFITDHGGRGRRHGGMSPEEMTVPWIIKGHGIRKGFVITELNNAVNTAATVASLFGAPLPLSWTAEVPESIFL